MVCYGLDADVAKQVFENRRPSGSSTSADKGAGKAKEERRTKYIKEDQRNNEQDSDYDDELDSSVHEEDDIEGNQGGQSRVKPLAFTNYARVGLQNFYQSNPELFLKRLAEGPPPEYRWLAWSFIGS